MLVGACHYMQIGSRFASQALWLHFLEMSFPGCPTGCPRRRRSGRPGAGSRAGRRRRGRSGNSSRSRWSSWSKGRRRRSTTRVSAWPSTLTSSIDGTQGNKCTYMHYRVILNHCLLEIARQCIKYPVRLKYIVFLFIDLDKIDFFSCCFLSCISVL